MKFKFRYILHIIGLGLLFYFIKSVDINLSAISLIKQPLYIPISIALYILFFIISAVRLNYFLKSIDNKSYDIKTLAKIEFISKYIYYITPSKLYLPAKALLLNKLCSVRKSTGLAIITFEYCIDTVITIAIALWGSIFLFNHIFEISTIKLTLALIAIITATIVFLSISPKYIENIFTRLRIKNKYTTKYIPVVHNLITTTKKTWSELIFNRKMRSILPIIVIQLIINALSTQLLFASTGLNVPIYWIIIVTSTMVFVGGISQVPGGIGIREGAGIILYAALGIPKEITLMVVLISRMYTIIPLIIGYWYSVVSLGHTHA